jgi:hypothetical protein
MGMMVLNAKGAADHTFLYGVRSIHVLCPGDCPNQVSELIHHRPLATRCRERVCNGYDYDVHFLPPRASAYIALLELMHHLCLVLTYDASSRESWDEVVATCKRMHICCDDGVLPLPAMIAAMGKGPVSHEEAGSLASQWGCLFVKLSPVTGPGVSDAIGLLVKIADSARDQCPTHQDNFRSDLEDPQRVAYEKRNRKRSEAIQGLFAE